MRSSRIVEEESAYYHIWSRVVDRRMVFDDDEKERFRKTLRAVASFSGIRIMTYVVLDNHFHALSYVPKREEVSDTELLRRLLFLYDKTVVENIGSHLACLRAAGNHVAADARKREFTYRMYDLGEFVKTLKQRVSMSYNKRHHRKGTLWEERFKSALIEGTSRMLSAMAAYIDLNPIRAGIVKDPKDYRFSGYGEAMGGSKEAREALMVVTKDGEASEGWAAVGARYRQLLFVKGEAKGLRADGQPVKKGISPEAVEEVIVNKGKLPLNEILRSRIRYFADGAIIGSRVFVEDAFGRHREHFSAKRATGARPMKGADFGDMFTARQLRVDVYGAAATV
ncbi:MAG: transposase [bacterium]